jgi:hypothetical protein
MYAGKLIGSMSLYSVMKFLMGETPRVVSKFVYIDVASEWKIRAPLGMCNCLSSLITVEESLI